MIGHSPTGRPIMDEEDSYAAELEKLREENRLLNRRIHVLRNAIELIVQNQSPKEKKPPVE